MLPTRQYGIFNELDNLFQWDSIGHGQTVSQRVRPASLTMINKYASDSDR